jgi:hypothetical protein
MFDYQAGEKYKLTLIMVGVAGLLAGMFFTLLLMPSPDMSPRHRHIATRASQDPDVTGHRGGSASAAGSDGSAGGDQGPGAVSASSGGIEMVNRGQAVEFMQNWLPRVWDLNAQTADANQEEAIKWMTADCASAYRQNIWSPETAKQVAESGLRSEWRIKAMEVSDNLKDGSVVVKVKGTQVLMAPAGQKSKDVDLEYMLKQTSNGMRIAGISDAGTR